MRRLRFRLVAFAQVALLAVLLGAGAVSLAEARPAYAASAGLSLSVEQPSTVPSGARPTIVLTATDQATAGTAYAASYQAVLPSGVQYIPGSTQPTGAVPLIFPNQPATGQTTVVWTDVSDIGPGAQGQLTFAVDPTSAAGGTFTIPYAFYSTPAPGTRPAFNSTSGTVIAGSYAGSATASATTTVSPASASPAAAPSPSATPTSSAPTPGASPPEPAPSPNPTGSPSPSPAPSPATPPGIGAPTPASAPAAPRVNAALAPAAGGDPTATTCGYGATGYQASTICWLDMSSYVEATAETSAGQAMTVALPGGYTVSFTVNTSPVAGAPPFSPVKATAFPTWSGAYIGNKAYTGTPGKPALYMTTSGGTTQITLSNITVVDSAGVKVTGYGLVVADAESSDNGEYLKFGSNVALNQLQIPGDTPLCAGGLSGLGTTAVNCMGSNSTGGNALAVTATAPSTVTATMHGSGLQAEAFAVVTSKLELTKSVAGRINPTDSFNLSIQASNGTTLGSATTGTSKSADTGQVTVLSGAGAGFTMTESATPGTPTLLSNYTPTWSCTDNGAPLSVSPTGGGSTVSVSPAVGDFILCTVTNTAKAVGLTLVKRAGTPVDVNHDGLVDAGDTIPYSFNVTNTGQLTLSAIAVADAKVGPVTCPLPTLAPGASETCTATYTITAADVTAGAVVNMATASGTPPGGTTPVTSAPSSTSTPTTAPAPGLHVDKTASPTAVSRVGERITYSFAVTNTGNVTITGIGVSDTQAAPAGPASAVTCPTTTLAPGAFTTCTATYTATQADLDHGSIADTATASGTAPSGSAVTSPPAAATVGVNQAPSLDLDKSAAPGTVTAGGQQVVYSFHVANTGDVTVSGLTINDTFAAPAAPVPAISCPVTTLGPGTSTTCTGTYTTTQADIDNGSITNTATAGATAANGSPVSSPPSTASVGVAQATGITLVKASSPAVVTAAGQSVAYSFTVTNTSTVTLSGVGVSDSFTSPSGAAPAVSCPVTTLAPGVSTTCTSSYVVTQADIDTGSFTDSATASGTTPSGTTIASSPSDATVGVTQSPALTAVKTASPSTITGSGQLIRFSIVVTNSGNVTISALGVVDTMASPAGPAPSVTCPVSTLGPGASTTCTASYTSTQGDVDNGSISNTASATGSAPDGETISSPASTATIAAAPSPALTLVKTASPTTASVAGQTITYSFAVTNSGNVTINDLVIADVLASPAGPVPVVSCPTTTLGPGASTTCTASYVTTQADIDNGSVTDTATATGDAPDGSDVSSPLSSASVSVTQSPGLTVVKTASPATVSTAGQSITYSYAVTNTGNVTVTGIGVSDTQAAPAGATSPVSCPSTSLAAGALMRCTATYTATQADLDHGSIGDTATASGTAPDGSSVTSPPAPATVGVTANPSLQVTKSASTLNVSAVGQVVTYSFLVNNDGNQTVSGIAVSDVFTSPAGDPSPVVACPQTTLAPGATMTCTATHTVTQADFNNGFLSNAATASGTSPSGAQVISTSDPTTVMVSKPQLTLVKTASPTTVSAVGQTVTYSFGVTNTGNVTITGIGVSDTQAAPAGPASAATCPRTTLAPGDSTICSATYVTTQADLDHGSIGDSATASGTAPDGSGVTSVPATATVGVNQAPSLDLDKSAAPGTVTAGGQQVVYSFHVANTGDVTVSGLTINDTFAAPAAPVPAISCPVTTLAPGTSTTCTGTYTTTQADVDNGSITNTATAGATAANGSPVSSPSSTASVGVAQATGITLVKAASPAVVTAAGQSVAYSFTVTNTSTVTLSGVGVSDSFTSPSGAAPAVSCPVTTLAPGVSTTCTSSYVVTQADIDTGSFTDSATASGTTPSGTTIASSPSDATVGVTQSPALTAVKTASPSTITGSGQLIRFSIVVTNSGNVTISALGVVDTMASPAGPAPSVTCPVSTLGPGASTTCTASYTSTQGDVDNGSISNTASATGSAPDGETISSPASTATIAAAPSPALTLVKTASPTTASVAGQTITYSFAVTNSGNVTINDLVIADVLASPAGPVPVVSCPTTTLGPGASTTCTASYVTTQADIDNGSVTDTATATGDAPDGSDVSSPLSSASVSVTQSPGLTVVKTASPATVSTAGQSITYSYAVTNTGNVTVTGIGVSDTQAAPAGATSPVSCPTQTLAPGASTTCSATYVTTQADLDHGSIGDTATASGTAPDGSSVTSPPAPATVAVNRLPSWTWTSRPRRAR